MSSLRKVGKDRLPLMKEYIEERLSVALNKMECGSKEEFDNNKGRVTELRKIAKEIDSLLKGG